MDTVGSEHWLSAGRHTMADTAPFLVRWTLTGAANRFKRALHSKTTVVRMAHTTRVKGIVWHALWAFAVSSEFGWQALRWKASKRLLWSMEI
ncbi:hypothetical protein SPHV1_2230004 [Novosphingobium sp. KN65.2]|nr:hypothetical protein SPHV1_2230004 [Novosphingobium sp. KN65.2]